MIKDHIQQPQYEKKFQTLKSNIKKIILKNIIGMAIVVFLIIIVLLIANWQFGLDVFLAPFESFGININPFQILLYSILAVVIITLFLLLSNYLAIRNVRFEFHQNKLILYKNSFLLFVNSKEIPYQNIEKILYNREGIFNKIFNSGTIVLELSGMEENKVELEFIDNVEQAVKYIQDLIQRFRAVKQEKTKESYKIGRILDQY